MTSLATAVGGMKHWDWCPICRGGLDTGLECDQCGADLMPIYKAFKDLQARPTDSAVLRGIKARADRSRLGYGGKAWVTSDPKSEVVEDRMILIEIVGRQEFAINRLRAALNEAADSFKNAGLSVDAEDCEQAINESLSGGNPGEPKACTPAEERGIVGATGAGQLPDDKPESTVDSAERRSPDGTERTPSPDESNRHHVSKSIVWMAKDRTYRETCYFGHYATAVAWANGGTVIPVEVFEPEAHDLRVTDGCAPDEPQPSEARGDDLAGWLEEMHDYARPIDQPKLMQAAALLRSSHEPEGVLALVKQKRDEYRSFLDAGKGTWPGSDYIQDETWARWQGAWSVLDSIVSQAERERPCLFDKLVGNPLDGFPSTKDGSHHG